MDTFVAPRRLFEEFRTHTPWLGPLLITTVVAVLATTAIPDSVFVEQTRDATNRLGKPVTVTSDPATIARWGRILSAFSAAILQPMVALGVAGLLALIFGVVMRAQARVPQYLAIATHALLVPALGTLFLLPFRFENPGLELSLALFAPFLTPNGWLFRLLTILNLFSLWTLLLLALGVSTVNRNVTWGRATAVLVGIYLTVGAVIATIPA